MKEKKEEYQEEENRQQEQAKKIRGNGFDAQVFGDYGLEQSKY